MNDLKSELEKQLNIPVAITAFSENTEMPFLIILPNIETHGSDDKIFYLSDDSDLELYTETSDDPIISKLSRFLIERNIKFQCFTTYIHTERMFETVFNLEKINQKVKE